MIQKRTTNQLFLVQCGDWESVRSAQSPMKACTDAMLEARREYGQGLKLSDVIISMNLQEQMENNPDAISAFSMASIKEFLKNEY